MNKLLITVLLIILIPLNVQAQETQRKIKKSLQAHDQQDLAVNYPLFESAYFKEGHILFKPFIPIDWESKAPERIKSINIKKPSQADLEYVKSGHSFFTYYSFYFDLPVPSEIEKAFHYLITTQGVLELKPINLHGTARFDLQGTSITNLVYYGDIVAVSTENRQIAEGGFVIGAPAPLKVSTSEARQWFTARSENKKIIHSYKRGSQTLTLTLQEDHPVKIINSYKIKLDGLDLDFIFVKWDKDDQCHFGCCSMSYSLFQANSELKEIKWTRYDCDI